LFDLYSERESEIIFLVLICRCPDEQEFVQLPVRHWEGRLWKGLASGA